MKIYKRLFIITLLIIIIALLTGCADAVDNIHFNDEPYGFWGGLWHGLISVLAFIGSLIWDDIAVYAINNNGAWYDFGFLLGVGAIGRFLRGGDD